ncbi:hypothetical protein ANCCAN_13456 [Ancylostoma caninum]|uniref:Uncharacterized protein n=1 Tax=Ancylostoma caninum TaxID=29170 RepID=A0A368G851_ANCCA|nr:hypothetical protein ANCCAN_13456 [Ancylostoma caninum]
MDFEEEPQAKTDPERISIQVVQHQGRFRRAIPCMPLPLAGVCCFFNVFIPGLGECFFSRFVKFFLPFHIIWIFFLNSTEVFCSFIGYDYLFCVLHRIQSTLIVAVKSV